VVGEFDWLGVNVLRNSLTRQIQLAAPEDAGPIASVLREAFAEYASCYTPAAFAATTPTADQIRQRWSEGPVWVAVLDSRIVGTISAVPRDDAMYVRSMAILPASRGRGIGRLLLDEVERFARHRHDARLFLSTTPYLHRAIRLYEQFGFARTAEGPHDLFGTPLFTMVKRL
jgi:GNAT superfamily N-acetyltransferase